MKKKCKKKLVDISKLLQPQVYLVVLRLILLFHNKTLALPKCS